MDFDSKVTTLVPLFTMNVLPLVCLPAPTPQRSVIALVLPPDADQLRDGSDKFVEFKLLMLLSSKFSLYIVSIDPPIDPS